MPIPHKAHLYWKECKLTFAVEKYSYTDLIIVLGV